MVVSKFSDHFWGEKLNGYDVLTQNLKHSINNVKELETYFRECASIDDAYIKLLTKLTLQTNKYSTNGTFYPLWSPIKELNERLNSVHLQQIQQTNEIVKEIQRYYDDLNKKLKRIRDNEAPTQQCVQNFQEITQLLTKSKEQYHAIAIEHEKQRRADNSNIQKLEKKLKQSLDEYKSNIEKYNNIRNDYERRLNDSFQNFQVSEETHLKQMRSLIENYGKLLINNNQNKTYAYQEFNGKIEYLNNDYLIQVFIDNKRTGAERPESVCAFDF
jgi:DNA repair exonuclease SbcCD ATPase subunit